MPALLKDVQTEDQKTEHLKDNQDSTPGYGSINEMVVSQSHFAAK